MALSLSDRADAQKGPWIAVLSTADSSAYMDSTAIRTISPGLIEIWSKRQYAMPRGSRTEIYDRLVIKSRIRCAVQSSVVLESALYKGETLVARSTRPSGSGHWSTQGMDPFTDAVIAKACSLAQGDSMAPPGSPDTSRLPVQQQAAPRWVIVCICPTGATRWGDLRTAVDVESVDSAGNGVYHARMREGGSGESYGALVISMVGYPYDTRIWRASFDCVNRRVRYGSATYYYRSVALPERKPDDPPRGPWLSATATDPDGILLEAFCRLDWKKAIGRG